MAILVILQSCDFGVSSLDDESVWCFLALLLSRKSLAKRGQSNCNPARGKPLVDSGGLSNRPSNLLLDSLLQEVCVSLIISVLRLWSCFCRTEESPLQIVD